MPQSLCSSLCWTVATILSHKVLKAVKKQREKHQSSWWWGRISLHWMLRLSLSVPPVTHRQNSEKGPWRSSGRLFQSCVLTGPLLVTWQLQSTISADWVNSSKAGVLEHCSSSQRRYHTADTTAHSSLVSDYVKMCNQIWKCSLSSAVLCSL